MRKHVIALMVLFAVAADAPQRAEAGAFATEITQLLNHAQLVLAYIRQGLQLENGISMLANMIRNTKNLSPQVFGQIAGHINALAQIVQGGQALAYSLGNLDQLFRSTYPGYGRTPTVYYANYQRWSRPLSIQLWERFARPGCRTSKCRANRLLSIRSKACHRRRTAKCRL